MPAVVQAVPLAGVHRRLEGTVDGPVGYDLFAVLPDAGCQAGHVGRAEAGGELGVAGPLHLHVEHVGLELQQEVVRRRAAVGLDGRDGHAGALAHGLQEVSDRVDDPFERRPGQVGALGPAADPDDQTPSVAVPVRGREAGQRGHHVHAAVVGHRGGQPLRLAGAPYQLRPVAQPLDCRAGHGRVAFERVGRPPALAPGDKAVDAPFRDDELVADVEVQERPGAVGAFDRAGLEAPLPEQRALLVGEYPRDRDILAEEPGIGEPVVGGLVAHLGEHPLGDPKLLQPLAVPQVLGQIVCPGDGGVRGRDRMGGPAGQLPDEPRVYGPEGQLSPFGPSAQRGVLVEPPGEHQRRVDGREREPGALVDLLAPLGREGIHHAGRPAVLPDYGPVHGLSGAAVPQDGGGPLVGDGHGGQLVVGAARPVHNPLADVFGGAPDLLGVVLDPVGSGVVLGELLVGLRHDLASAVHEHRPGAGGPLVDDQYMLSHGFLLCWRPCLRAEPHARPG